MEYTSLSFRPVRPFFDLLFKVPSKPPIQMHPAQSADLSLVLSRVLTSTCSAHAISCSCIFDHAVLFRAINCSCMFDHAVRFSAINCSCMFDHAVLFRAINCSCMFDHAVRFSAINCSYVFSTTPYSNMLSTAHAFLTTPYCSVLFHAINCSCIFDHAGSRYPACSSWRRCTRWRAWLPGLSYLRRRSKSCMTTLGIAYQRCALW